MSRAPHLAASFLLFFFALAPSAPAQEDEIVANLAGGRLIILVARDTIVFGAIDHPLEATSVPPRVAEVDKSHVGIFFGASEWQSPASPRPIRLDLDRPVVGVEQDKRYRQPGDPETDLEQLGMGYLEKLRPLVAQLHTPIDLKPDEPLLSIVLIGYGPQNYGPEAWLVEYHIEQHQVGREQNYMQTRILRPHFTQLYPPEKHEAHTLVEVRFPDNLPGIPLLGLLQQSDPPVAAVRSAEARFGKVADLIEHGQSPKANPADATDFLRVILPILAGKAPFFEATIGEDTGFRWVVPPSEPRPKTKAPEDKDRPPEAPTLRRKPN